MLSDTHIKRFSDLSHFCFANVSTPPIQRVVYPHLSRTFINLVLYVTCTSRQVPTLLEKLWFGIDKKEIDTYMIFVILFPD